MVMNKHLALLAIVIFGPRIKRQIVVEFVRELFVFKDGGTIALDWVEEIPTVENRKPIIVISPGYNGGSKNTYCLSIIREAKKHGYIPVVLNFRGQAEVPLTSPLLQCATNTDDFREPMEYIYKRYC